MHLDSSNKEGEIQDGCDAKLEVRDVGAVEHSLRARGGERWGNRIMNRRNIMN